MEKVVKFLESESSSSEGNYKIILDVENFSFKGMNDLQRELELGGVPYMKEFKVHLEVLKHVIPTFCNETSTSMQNSLELRFLFIHLLILLDYHRIYWNIPLTIDMFHF